MNVEVLAKGLSALKQEQDRKRNKNPHTEALPYLNAIPNFGREAYQPYINQGQQAFGQLPDYQQMAQNPTDFLNMLMGQYEPSVGYKRKHENLMKTLGSIGAQGGYAGTPLHQEQSGQLANSLLDEDMQRFLENVLGIQGFGTQGIENQVGRGYNAAGNLADYLGAAHGQLGQSAFAGRASRNAANQAWMNNLFKAGAGAAGTAAGAYFGGHAGAAAASGAMGGAMGGTGGGAGSEDGGASYGIPGFGQQAMFGGGRYGNPSGQYNSLNQMRF